MQTKENRPEIQREQLTDIETQQVNEVSVNKWKRRARGQINADMMPVNPHATRKRKTEEGNILFALENNQDARGKNKCLNLL